MQVVLSLIVCLLPVQVLGFGTLCSNEPLKKNLPRDATVLEPDTTVAYFGDQGTGSLPTAVLNLIKNYDSGRGVDLVVHLGDYDYADSPAAMREVIDSVLGPNYPYVAAIGNHDIDAWDGPGGYLDLLTQRLANNGMDRYCWGELGVNMGCMYKGLVFALSGVGTQGIDHTRFISDTFDENPALWRICGWHKNQRIYQIGGKEDEVGWEAYETCLAYGAAVATGHEHSWSRSHLMSGFQNHTVADTSHTLKLEPGRSFVFVSGVGGRDLRAWDETLRSNPWWASIAATNNGLMEGALFCTYYVDGQPDLARCEFRYRNDQIVDTFELRSLLSKNSISTPVCAGRWVEYPITNSENDGVQHKASLALSDAHLVLNSSSLVALRFDGVELDEAMMNNVQEIRLQVYGAVSSNVPIKILINAERGNSNSLSSSFSHPKRTKASVVWDSVDRNPNEEWEKHEVWVSHDLTSVVAEAVSSGGWTRGGALTLLLHTEGERTFYSFDHSKCVAPTLTVEFKAVC